MKSFRIPFILVLIPVLLFCEACAATPTTPPPTTPPSTPTPHAGKALLESRCSTCHPLTTVSTVKYDQAGWDVTVKRMVNVGAQLNQEQAKQVVDYLALTFK